VAGIHRLFARLDVIRAANVLIVVAGMEGALASVVSGLVDKPVIAVPTSVGMVLISEDFPLFDNAEQLCGRNRCGKYR